MLNDITITWVLVYYKCFCIIGTDSIVCFKFLSSGH